MRSYLPWVAFAVIVVSSVASMAYMFMSNGSSSSSQPSEPAPPTQITVQVQRPQQQQQPSSIRPTNAPALAQPVQYVHVAPPLVVVDSWWSPRWRWRGWTDGHVWDRRSDPQPPLVPAPEPNKACDPRKGLQCVVNHTGAKNVNTNVNIATSRGYWW